eukprot:55426-Rhodomonas_salina.1
MVLPALHNPTRRVWYRGCEVSSTCLRAPYAVPGIGLPHTPVHLYQENEGRARASTRAAPDRSGHRWHAQGQRNSKSALEFEIETRNPKAQTLNLEARFETRNLNLNPKPQNLQRCSV